MKVIGITGGTGAGKTTALDVLRELGAAVIDCDAVYHGLLRSDRALVQAIGERFPGAVRDGVLDRRTLAAAVFASPEGLETLSGITWPFVDRAVRKELQEASREGKNAAIDAIALFESDLSELCDVTVFVTAPVERRLRRIMARDGLDEARAQARIAAQKPDSFFEERCGYVLRNDFDSGEGFRAHCRDFFGNILGKSGAETAP